MSKTATHHLPAFCSDKQRLEALRRYNIFDTPAEKEFDDIAQLIAGICAAPIAVINFIDEDQQFFKAEVGLNVRQMPLATSICAHAFVEEELFIVPDTTLDERFAANVMVTRPPHLRFYAGAALRTPDGHALGTLCVLDTVPRELTELQKTALSTLARQVMIQLELRRALAAAVVTETALRLANATAEAESKAKDLCLSFLSHELRSPLTPVLLIATTMTTDPGLSPECRADAAVIQRNIELATRLTDDLLDVTRLAHGKMHLRLEAVDVHAVLRSALAMCAADAAAKGILLVLKPHAARHGIEGDPLKLTQVLVNLLKNGIKFTPVGGTVSLVSSNGADGSLIIEVSDTGVGIGAELLPHIFNLYEQGGSHVTRESGGLGLGLAICKGIVEVHRGTIAAQSRGKDCGTCMRVELPISAQADLEERPVERAVELPHAAAAANALNILLVDDHPDTLRTMSRLLTRLRHRVTTASCVRDALSVDSTEMFDVLISDVGLPDGTGMDLLRQLLQRHPIKGIALTGYGSESDLEETRAAGFLAHLVKPINFSQLEGLLEKVGD